MGGLAELLREILTIFRLGMAKSRFTLHADRFHLVSMQQNNCREKDLKGCLNSACVGMEDAANFFGWPAYYMPFLVRAGHLKPLGKPAQNARKWFAAVELERLSRDPDWLDKAIRIVEKQIREMNEKQKGRVTEQESALAE